MRHIQKSRPPHALVEFAKKNPGGRWDDLPTDVKDAVRSALYRDQGGLCAYCTRAVDAGSIRVEHLIARSSPEGRPRELEWRNLLGCCWGDHLLPPRLQTCDVRRRNAPLGRVDPLDHPERYVRFQSNGEIDASDPTARHDLVKTLNLNAKQLLVQRRAAMNGIDAALGSGSWSRERLLRARLRYAQGDYRDVPFQPAIVQRLERLLRQRES